MPTERNTSTYTYATQTYSGLIVDVPVFSWPSSILRCESPSTTTTLGFLTRDPIGLVGGANLYEFIGGHPFDGVDPTGLFFQSGDGPPLTPLSFPRWWQVPPQQPPLPPTPAPPLPPPVVVAPIVPAPPLSPAGYGHYCGPARMAKCVKGPGGGYLPAPGQPAPIDALDAACMAHDCCLATWREALNECFKPVCNPALCTAMAAMSCGAIYTDPQDLYDCQYMKLKAWGLFCTGAVPPSNTL